VIDNDTLAYDVPDTSALEEWAASTFQVVDDETTNEFIMNIKLGPYATLTYFANNQQLLFHTAHWRTDGIGSLLLLNAFLGFLLNFRVLQPCHGIRK
jgi:hypothetical protein